MPDYTLRIGENSFFINARGEGGALILARSILTDDMHSRQDVTIVEDGIDGPVILASTVGAMRSKDVDPVSPRQALSSE